MPDVSLRIPQIGEGLQEARLVAVLKQPGEYVRRDEPIYQMETDKAVMDVESPYEGTLKTWLAETDELLAIGAEVAVMEVARAVEEAPGHAPVAAPSAEEPASGPVGARNAAIPPRTRAYAREKGLTDDELMHLEPAGARLMPEDVDRHLAGRSQERPYHEAPLSSKQRLLASRLVRGNQLVVPGTMSVVADWEPLEAARARFKAAGGEFQPSLFTLFAYASTLALKEFPAFRSTLVGESTLRTFNHVNLGVAVSLPGDELVLAVVEGADRLSFREFAEAMRERVRLAREGTDQVNETVTFSLTNMAAYGLRDAIPVVVPPMVGTLFIGEPYIGLRQGVPDLQLQRCCNLGLTFDHRVINGVGGAEFLNAVKRYAEEVAGWVER